MKELSKEKIFEYSSKELLGVMRFDFYDGGLAKDEEEDDMLYLLLDNKKQFSIGISYIIDIEEL